MTVVVRRLIALALLAGGLVLLVTPRSGAAPETCVKGWTEASEAADAVFLGTVTDVQRSGRGQDDAEFAHTVEVDRVYKGPISAPSVPVRTVADTRKQPGLGKLELGERYLFFAQVGEETLSAGGCSGTTLAEADRVTRVEELLGEGRLAVPPPAPPEAEFEPVAESDPADFTRTAAPGLALVLVGLLGLIVVRRLGRRQPL